MTPGRILKMRKASAANKPALVPNPKSKLLDQVREVLRFHHYSLRTEKAYCQWIKRYLVFHRGKNGTKATDGTEGLKGWRHPKDMGGPEVAAFLSHLATVGQVSAATQNQALNALVFLYEQVLQVPLGNIGEFARVKRPARLPEALTQAETRRVIGALKPGTAGLVIRLLYGTGLRLIEALRLRVKDIDFERNEIVVEAA